MNKYKYLIETDIGCNKINVKQSSSGFWYCADLTINCISIIDGIALTDRAIDDLMKVLNDKNKIKEKENDKK